MIGRDIRIGRSGEFAIPEVPPCEWPISILAVSATRTSDQRKLAITDARFGASNPITGSITVAESGNPMLEIELSTDTGRVVGRVKRAGQAAVMVERVGAVKRRMDFPGGRVNPDGSFVVEDLAPGIYEVHTFAGKPVLVEVKSGETVTVEVD